MIQDFAIFVLGPLSGLWLLLWFISPWLEDDARDDRP